MDMREKTSMYKFGFCQANMLASQLINDVAYLLEGLDEVFEEEHAEMIVNIVVRKGHATQIVDHAFDLLRRDPPMGEIEKNEKALKKGEE